MFFFILFLLIDDHLPILKLKAGQDPVESRRYAKTTKKGTMKWELRGALAGRILPATEKFSWEDSFGVPSLGPPGAVHGHRDLGGYTTRQFVRTSWNVALYSRPPPFMV